LRIEVGLERPWTPEHAHQVFPEGTDGGRGPAKAFIERRRLVFDRPYAEGRELHAVNRRGWLLRSRGRYLTVVELGQRRFDFVSPDDGQSWRLKRIERVDRPGIFTRLEYENDRLTALALPNGERVRYRWSGNRVKRIEGPFDRLVRLQRNPSGYITEVRIESSGTDGQSEKETRVHTYERAISSDLLGYSAPTGRTYEVERDERKTEQGQQKIVLIRRDDGSYYFEGRVEGDRRAYYATGYGGPDQPVGEAVRFTESEWHETWLGKRPKQKTRRGRALRFEHGGKGFLEAMESPSAGWRRRYNGLGRLAEWERGERSARYRYTPEGRLTRRDTLSGERYRYERDEKGRVRRIEGPEDRVWKYRYDDRGFPKASETPKAKHSFHFDDWGRLRRWTLERDGEKRVRSWSYDDRGRLRGRTRRRDGETVRERRYKYDGAGRLAAIKNGSGDTLNRWNYGEHGRPIRHEPAGKAAVTHRYDELHRLTMKRVPREKVTRYRYHPWGPVKRRVRLNLQTRERSVQHYGRFGRPKDDEETSSSEDSS
jgi:YD repeat-containing protein